MLFDFLRARVTGHTVLRVLELYRKNCFPAPTDLLGPGFSNGHQSSDLPAGLNAGIV